MLFEGTAINRLRTIDVYDRRTLMYRGSTLLPFEASRLAVRGDTMVVIGEVEDEPVVAAFLLASTDAGTKRTRHWPGHVTTTNQLAPSPILTTPYRAASNRSASAGVLFGRQCTPESPPLECARSGRIQCLPLPRGDTLTGVSRQDASSKTPSAPVASHRAFPTTNSN
ncbi:MAG: hypothetical protein Q8K82_23830 [Gemmatimonadaceae bacterium]|nr:hypothetical protein [Gemmatimonadaceae bacterium]